MVFAILVFAIFILVSQALYTGLWAAFPGQILGGTYNAVTTTPYSYLSATIKCALLTTSFVPNQTSGQFNWGDISASEVTGTNYSAGGTALSSKAITTTSLTTTLTAANVTWATSTISNARFAALYQSTGTASTSPLIANFDFGSGQSSSANNFVVAWNASGIISLPVTAFA